MNDSSIAGFELPLHASLAQPILIAGVPRNMAILTLIVTLFAAIGLKAWQAALPLGFVVHGASVFLTRRDADWFPVFRRHLKHAEVYET